MCRVPCFVFLGLLAGSPAARALSFSPVSITPVSTAIAASASCQPGSATFAAITQTEGSGQINLSEAVSAGGVQLHVNGFGTGGPGSTMTAEAYADVDVAVPQIGDAMTPLLVSIDGLTKSGSGWSIDTISVTPGTLDTATCQESDRSPHSAQLNVDLEGNLDGFSSYGETPTTTSSAVVDSYPAGDTVRLHLEIFVSLSLQSSLGSFDDSFTVTVKSSAPAIGNGDMNGDHAVDILDATILRRQIAGLPVN